MSEIKILKKVVGNIPVLDPTLTCTNKLKIVEREPFDLVNEIMNFTNLNKIRLSAYDPKKAEWKYDFYYYSNSETPKLEKNLEYCINLIQPNGFIPMLDGQGKWDSSIIHILDRIYLDIPYKVYNSGNSYHVYWGFVSHLDDYFKFFSNCILNYTKDLGNNFNINYDLIKSLDIRWLSYNMQDNKGGLRFTANKVVKQTIIVPELIYSKKLNFNNPFKPQSVL